MKRIVMVLGLLAGAFVGVAQGGEGAPAPTDSEDMKRIVTYCHLSCFQRVGECYNGCRDEGEEALCGEQCEDGFDICQSMCEDIFGGGSL
jgi:hypothetical protein